MKSLTKLNYTKDASGFARDTLEFPLDPVQSGLLALNPSRCLINCTRQWGKSTITAIQAAHHAVFTPGSLTLALSPSERQSGEFIHKVQQFVAKAGFKTRGDGKNHLSIQLANGSRVIGLPSKESTIRGFSGVSLLLIDEAARVPDELYYTVRPMLAVSGGALWLISTPAGCRGFFHQAWISDGTQSAQRQPLCAIQTQSAQAPAVVRDTEWTRISVPATECPRISPAFLQSERQTLGELFFRQEYLCEFIDEGVQLVSRDLIQRALSDDIQPLNVAFNPARLIPPAPQTRPPCSFPDILDRRKYYVGIDFGKINDYTAIVVLEKSRWIVGESNRVDFEREREIRNHVRLAERFPLGTSYTEIGYKIAQIINSLDSSAECCIIADATGVGEAAIDQLRNHRLGHSIHAVTITGGETTSKNGLRWSIPKHDLSLKLALPFENGDLKIAAGLPLAPVLCEEISNLGVKIHNTRYDGFTWRSDQHDDLVFAVALANWAATEDKWYEGRSPGVAHRIF